MAIAGALGGPDERMKRGPRIMSADTRLNQFNGAVRECLEQCYRSDNWLASLGNYSERLRADGWSRGEIASVQTAVRRILGAVVQVDSGPLGGPKSQPSADVAAASL
jgi:hypothetical protein